MFLLNKHFSFLQGRVLLYNGFLDKKLERVGFNEDRQATINDYDQIMTILKDGANQLAERGVDQWKGRLSSPDQIKDDIEKGFAHLCCFSRWRKLLVSLPIVEAPDHSYDNLKGKWLRNTDKYVFGNTPCHNSFQHAGNGYATKFVD